MSFKEAIEAGNLIEVQKLVERGVDLERVDPHSGLLPLEQAANRGHLEIFKALLKADVKHRNALIYATKNNQIAIIQALLDAGTNLDVRDVTAEFAGWTPVMHAAFLGRTQAIEILSRAGANLEISDSQGRTALILAAQFGQNLAVSTLIKAGANVNHQDCDGSSALSYACRGRHPWMLDRLRQAGASQEGVKEISLVEAAERGDLRAVKALIKAGVEINSKNIQGYTALQKACYKGHARVVTTLIQAAANVNLGNGNFTPLMEASNCGRIKIVKMLIEAGADIDATNSGFNALAYAHLNGHKKIVQLLQQTRTEKQQKAPLTIRSEK